MSNEDFILELAKRYGRMSGSQMSPRSGSGEVLTSGSGPTSGSGEVCASGSGQTSGSGHPSGSGYSQATTSGYMNSSGFRHTPGVRSRGSDLESQFRGSAPQHPASFDSFQQANTAAAPISGGYGYSNNPTGMAPWMYGFGQGMIQQVMQTMFGQCPPMSFGRAPEGGPPRVVDSVPQPPVTTQPRVSVSTVSSINVPDQRDDDEKDEDVEEEESESYRLLGTHEIPSRIRIPRGGRGGGV